MLQRVWTWDTWSNLAYAAAGVAATWGDGPMGMLFMASMIAMTVGSGLYHAGLKHGNHLDVGVMYIIGGILAGVAAGFTGGIAVVLVLIASIAVAHVLRFRLTHIKLEYKIPVLYAGALVVGGVHGIDWLYMGPALGLLATAGLFRFLVHKPWAHGLWHVLTAPGLALWYRGVA